jgi:two-component system sensor histidine kinase BaeS
VLSASRAGEEAIQLSVTDNGEGIPAGALPRVFERFYRTDSARSRDRGGSGIGLTIARAIAEAHGGTLRAESEGAGRGARFVCALPVGRS